MSICNYSGQIVRRDTPLLPEEGWTRHKADAAKPPLKERTGWSLTSHISECVLNTACERRRFLMAAPYYLRFRAIALTLRAGLRGLRPPSAPLRRLRDIFLVAQPPLLWEEGSMPPEDCELNSGVAAARPVSQEELEV